MKPLGNEPSNILEPPQPEEGKKAWEDYADTLTTKLQEARATIDRLEGDRMRLLCKDHRGHHNKGKTCLACRIDESTKRVEKAEAQRDNAWAADKVIRETISANPEEATSDEVARVVAQLQGYRAALEIGVKYGGIDGAHHKDWVIDQMIRKLAGDGYDKLVAESCAGEDGPDTYGWDCGIAP